MTDTESSTYVYKIDRCKNCVHCKAFEQGFLSKAIHVVCRKLPDTAYMAIIPTDLDKKCSHFILKEEREFAMSFNEMIEFNQLKTKPGALVGKYVKIRGTNQKIQILFDKRTATTRFVNDIYFICVTESGQSIDIGLTDIEGFWKPATVEKAQAMFSKLKDPSTHIILPQLFTLTQAERFANKKQMKVVKWPAPNTKIIVFNADGEIIE